jgi:hypothetical protein
MFNSKQKKAASAANKAFTTTGLLKAALAHDDDAMTQMVTGQTANDEGIRFALETFIGVAHRHRAVVSRLEELAPTMPDKAQTAFASGIMAASVGSMRAFQGGNVVGQGLFIMSLAAAISEDDSALADALATVKEFTEGGGR